MECNIGNTDRQIRIILAIILMIIGIFEGPWISFIGILVLITVVTKFCGIYKLLRINTCKEDKPVKSKRK
jgi:hypothetical protein